MTYNNLGLQSSSGMCKLFTPPNYYSSDINTKKKSMIPSLSDIMTGIDMLVKSHMQTDDNSVYISQINEGLCLYNPITLPYRKEEGYYTIEYRICNLFIEAVGETYSEMVKDFKDQLADAWDYYIYEENQNLTQGALHVKRWLQENIRER